jgi:hypothetical protein
VIELPDDFRDLLVELYDAAAAFVIVGGHAVAFHGHPRATKDLDVLVRGDGANARLVYRELAAFGAPLQTFEANESDKRAAGRPQGLADAHALEATAARNG